MLTRSMLKKLQIVPRGKKVMIVAQSGRMEVQMMGKSLDNGAIGDRVKVMNLKSQQKLEGIITSSTEVRIEIKASRIIKVILLLVVNVRENENKMLGENLCL